MTIADTPPLTLGEIVEHLGRYVDRFEVGELSPSDAATAAKRFGKVKRMAQTAELLCIKRAAETSKVRRRDDVDGSKWAGRQLGTSPGHAAELLNLAGGLESAPQTLEALKAGDISTEQAAEVVRTEKVAPGSERNMLDQAENSSLTELKRRGRKVRAAAIGPEEQAARVHRGRYLRAWVDDDGAGRGSWSLELAEHTQFMALVEAHTDLVFQEARREGRREPMDAYRADALVRVARAALRSPKRRGPKSSSSAPDDPAPTDAGVGAPASSGADQPDQAEPGPTSGPTPDTPSAAPSPANPPPDEPPSGPSPADPPPDEPPSGPPPAGPSPPGPTSGPTPEAPPAEGQTSVSSDRGSEAPAPAEVLVHVSHRLLLEGLDDPRDAATTNEQPFGVGFDRCADEGQVDNQLKLADLAGPAHAADHSDPTNAADRTPSVPAADRADPADVADVAKPGDLAEIVGQGPIPVGVVRQWLGQGAFVALVVTADDDPLDVRSVLHLGRRSPLVRQLWSPVHGPAGRPAGPDRDTSAHHIKVIVQLTEQELRHPASAPLQAAVRMRGVDVADLVHRGRRPNAVQRTALQWRSPVCAVLGCSNRIRLEADHVVEWCLTGHTTLSELEHLCRQHHRMKTHDGYRLAPGTGKRPLLPPTDPLAEAADP
ncbi:hypothetical protein [Rhabdothermincola salaria]|uniref:hypothetical protein n=1 Tax=Rhabdothermincola salaria TaxID=2903142 RepID=UPI001E63FFE3|nr:hypothetical protein [Rhabdothermincola salaria]MCD9623944.1 hypothetical protein [Rhabdothermincola salaria]